MSRSLQHVYVIQCASTGEFLTWDLEYAHSLKLAGRAPDLEHAVETARAHLDDDYEIHEFFVLQQDVTER